MAYKTILVHVDDSRQAAERIRIAARLARAYDAHLIGAAATGISRYAFQGGATLPPDPSLAIHLEYLRQRAQRALDQAEPLVQQEGLSTLEKRLLDDDASGGLGTLARYSDLVVIGQADPGEAAATVLSDFPEYIVFTSGRPALIIPYAGAFASIGKRVLIAWDGGRSATRAVTDALPLLRQAELVQVALFNQDGTASQEPPLGSDIALYLARHGIKTELLPSRPSGNIGDSLLTLAADLGADLIVMGGYGHSRFREILLGGVTRTMLASMTVPVLMSH
ncbi:universal stress protein [Noviherbaspirillum sedimenti]|uniref:Universal stress protein n=1 Tax=Noviherbaspirillum sedimenti TaxID=2320865 RepID=A0A3A3G7Z0_9BURK|nr:universal stress protein [Noviherbaspirillum sedimenti]RJG04623.1 universal stress protein [Noviherbaspirillum sedimenti]